MVQPRILAAKWDSGGVLNRKYGPSPSVSTLNGSTTTDVRGIRFRKVLLDWCPEVFVTEESELINTIIFVKWPNRLGNRLVEHMYRSLQIRKASLPVLNASDG